MFNINCSPKSPCIPCYVVCKYDRPARENAIFTHCSSKFTSYWSFQIQTFPSAKLSFCSWWCLCNELADYFKESKSRPCLLRTSSISDPGKIYPWLKCFLGGISASQRGFIFNFSNARLPWFIIASAFHFSCPVSRPIFLFCDIVSETSIANREEHCKAG